MLLPVKWARKDFKSKAIAHTPSFEPLNYYLVLNSAKVSVSEMNTKKLCKRHVPDLREIPTAQSTTDLTKCFTILS